MTEKTTGRSASHVTNGKPLAKGHNISSRWAATKNGLYDLHTVWVTLQRWAHKVEKHPTNCTMCIFIMYSQVSRHIMFSKLTIFNVSVDSYRQQYSCQLKVQALQQERGGFFACLNVGHVCAYQLCMWECTETYITCTYTYCRYVYMYTVH